MRENKPNIKTAINYYNWVRNNDIPNFIPKQPRTAYKNKGWDGWPTFFSVLKHDQ